MPFPWMIKMERLAFLVFSTIPLVQTVTYQLTELVKVTLKRVAITFAPPTNRQIRHTDVLIIIEFFAQRNLLRMVDVN